MASINQKFVLVGPNAGKTLLVNGHEFVNGEMTFQGGAAQAAALECLFEYYSVLTVEKAELRALRTLRGKQKPEGGEQLGNAIQAGYVAQGGQADAQGNATAIEATEPAQDAPSGAPDTKLSLAEAIGLLNPEVQAHWTTNNLPSLEYLGELIGKKVTRDEVATVAEGYTRAKARAVKQ